MFNCSANTLKQMATLVWCSGPFFLLSKSFVLLSAAYIINPNTIYISLIVILGILIGGLKAKFLFYKLCIKNLNRIKNLKKPKYWQFYRPQFFVFMFSMIVLGKYLAIQATDNYYGLISLAVVEISIGIALMASCICFWKSNNK